MKKILVEGGYYDYQKGKYYFFVQDHLGNTRLVVNREEGVVQKNDYYPFGMEFADNTGNDQPYKYNGKELDNTHGLNLYDYSARFYDPIIGRFTTMDPLAEKYYHTSPYAYCGNNPVNRIDPDGMDWYLYYNESENENKYAWSPEPTNQKQLDNVFGKGKTQYLGITHTQGDTYYGLTGDTYDVSTKEGKVMQKIDDAIIKHYFAVNSGDVDLYPSTDFDIGEYPTLSALKTTQNSYFAFYSQDGAQITYYKVAKGVPNKAKYGGFEKTDEKGNYKIRGNKSYSASNLIDGITIRFERQKTAGSYVTSSATMTFPTQISAKTYSNTISKLLYKR